MIKVLNKIKLAETLAVLILAGLLYPDLTSGQRTKRKPENVRNVGIQEHLGETIPLNLTFATANGDSVTLGSLIEEEKPVLLNPVYYNCPMLCTMVIDAVFQSVKKIDWTPGNEYNIITFSINPKEDHKLAATVKDSIVQQMSRKNAGEGWYFLTGNQQAITRLTQAIGFKYEKVEGRNQFAHAASIMFLSPEGKLTRYLYGISYKPFNIRNALSEAVNGDIGSAVDKVLLYCFVYNAEEGSYTAEATRIMKVGGIITLTGLIIFLGFMWFGKKLFKNDKNRSNELA